MHGLPNKPKLFGKKFSLSLVWTGFRMVLLIYRFPRTQNWTCGPVLKSSGSNFSSGPNCSSPNPQCRVPEFLSPSKHLLAALPTLTSYLLPWRALSWYQQEKPLQYLSKRNWPIFLNAHPNLREILPKYLTSRVAIMMEHQLKNTGTMEKKPIFQGAAEEGKRQTNRILVIYI